MELIWLEHRDHWSASTIQTSLLCLDLDSFFNTLKNRDTAWSHHVDLIRSDLDHQEEKKNLSSSLSRRRIFLLLFLSLNSPIRSDLEDIEVVWHGRKEGRAMRNMACGRQNSPQKNFHTPIIFSLNICRTKISSTPSLSDMIPFLVWIKFKWERKIKTGKEDQVIRGANYWHPLFFISCTQTHVLPFFIRFLLHKNLNSHVLTRLG